LVDNFELISLSCIRS